MTWNDTASSALQPPLGSLERKLIAEFLQSRGYALETMDSVPEAERHAVLTEASTYASSRLTEIESRSHFVHELHGAKEPGGGRTT
jgi:hypothetical protein